MEGRQQLGGGLTVGPPLPGDDQRHLFFRRVVAGIGWAIHSLVFETMDGIRIGYNLANDGTEMNLTDDDLASRGARDWIDIENAGWNRIVRVEGNHGGGGYLCSVLNLIFASGYEIKFATHHQPYIRQEFAFDVVSPSSQQQPGMLQRIDFGRGGCGRPTARFSSHCRGLIVIPTSIHLPISLDTFALLPERVQNSIRCILLCGNRAVDATDSVHISTEVWWNILGMLRGIDLLV